MKLKAIECPRCKGNLIDKGNGTWVCESCRSLFQEEKDEKTININKNVNIKNDSTKTIRDEAKIKEIEKEMETNKSDARLLPWFVVVWVGLCAFGMTLDSFDIHPEHIPLTIFLWLLTTILGIIIYKLQNRNK